MIWIFLKGVAVGVAVAAPVGPIGLLCIKRTLDRGWATGVASGLGVAGADATYGMMVAAGLAATGLLLAHAGPMQLAGGLMIAFLGLQSLRAGLRAGIRAAPGRAARGGSGGGLAVAFVSAYALTLTNPMTILAFAGLVAGLGPSAGAEAGAPFVLVAGVFAGSLGWWVVLASGTALARRRITPAVTRWLDLGSGAVLLGWGLWLAWGALAAR